MFNVVALGELLIDFTNNGTSNQGNALFEANPGGAPCNVLSMLQRLGKKTAFIGKVGNDHLGKTLIEVVKEQGINTENLLVDSSIPTTLAFVHTKEGGDRSFSFYRKPGADMMLRKKDIQTSVLRNTQIFHFGTLSMTDKKVAGATKFAVSEAKKAGALISFDPNYRPLLWDNPEKAKKAMWFGISKCDILKISDDEIEFLTGESDIDKGIEVIRSKFSPKIVCATMGKEGSKAYYGEKSVFCKSYSNVKTIETTGAGDTFMACVLNEILEVGIDAFSEFTLKEMLKFANAAASIITTRKGALKVMPTRDEVISLIVSAQKGADNK